MRYTHRPAVTSHTALTDCPRLRASAAKDIAPRSAMAVQPAQDLMAFMLAFSLADGERGIDSPARHRPWKRRVPARCSKLDVGSINSCPDDNTARGMQQRHGRRCTPLTCR